MFLRVKKDTAVKSADFCVVIETPIAEVTLFHRLYLRSRRCESTRSQSDPKSSISAVYYFVYCGDDKAKYSAGNFLRSISQHPHLEVKRLYLIGALKCIDIDAESAGGDSSTIRSCNLPRDFA